jgi:hypothetical protein
MYCLNDYHFTIPELITRTGTFGVPFEEPAYFSIA